MGTNHPGPLKRTLSVSEILRNTHIQTLLLLFRDYLFAGSACLATTSKINEDMAESKTSPVRPKTIIFISLAWHDSDFNAVI